MFLSFFSTISRRADYRKKPETDGGSDGTGEWKKPAQSGPREGIARIRLYRGQSAHDHRGGGNESDRDRSEISGKTSGL